MKLNVLISYGIRYTLCHLGEPPRAHSHIHTQVASCIIRWMVASKHVCGKLAVVQHASRFVPNPLFMYNRAMRRSSIRCDSVMFDHLSDWLREISFWQIPTQRCLVLMGGIMSDTHTHSITNFHVSFERFALNSTFYLFFDLAAAVHFSANNVFVCEWVSVCVLHFYIIPSIIARL